MRVITALKNCLIALLVLVLISGPAVSLKAANRTDHNVSRRVLSTAPNAAGIFRITLTKDVYAAGENIEVRTFSDRAGGGLEDDIGQQSHNIPQGDSPPFALGPVPGPGLYFTRYRVGGDTIINGFLILPATNNRFTVEIVTQPTCTATVTQAQTEPVKKYFRNLTVARLQTAATAVAPGWFAVNGQNFAVQVAKGIVLAYSGLGFIAIVAQEGLARDVAALAIDFVSTVMARAADDMSPSVLTQTERDFVKLALSGLNNVIQTVLADNLFQKVVTLGQAANEIALGSDPDSQVFAKIVGDSVKKFEVLVRLRRP
ncbi:MAG TPA: hypothetical protein VFI71_03870 [Pyrinomonadaceae bacterium]|nr:hypothetical protein [Pyrinomonadaceae bacterium]